MHYLPELRGSGRFKHSLEHGFIVSKFRTPNKRVIALLVLVPPMAGIFFMLSSLAQPITGLYLVALTGLLLLYTVFCVLAGRLEHGRWAGYINLTVLAGWLAIGIGPVLLLIVAGSAFGGLILWKSDANRRYEWFYEVAGRIAITGNAALVGYAIYVWMGGIIPLRGFERWLHLPALISGVVVQFVMLQLLGVLLTSVTPQQQTRTLRDTLHLEALIALLAVVLPVILFDVGPVAFAIISGLAVAQAYRYRQVERTGQSLKSRIQDMALLSHLAQEISTQLELDDLLEVIYTEMQQLVDAHTFFIALYDDDQGRIEYPLVYSMGRKTEWPTRARGGGLTDHVIDSGQTLNYSEADLPDTVQASATQAGAQAYLGVPLSVGEKIIGVMGVTHQTNPRAFDETDIELLETIANQASLAVRNAMLYERTLTMANSLAFMNESLQDVLFNLDDADAMRTACQIATQISGAQKVAVFLLDSPLAEDMQQMLAIGFGTPHHAPDTLPYQPDMYDDGPLTVADVRVSDDPALQQLAAQGGFRACAQVPVWSGASLRGVLLVCHDDTHYYDKTDLNLLEVLGNQITAALDNADLLQTLEMYASEQSQLVHLSRISSSNLDLERIIYDVTDVLSDMMNSEHLRLVLHEPEAGLLRLYHHEADTPRMTTQDIPDDTFPELDTLMESRSAVNVTTFRRGIDDLSQPLKAYLDEYDLASLTMMPMIINRETMGLVLVGRPENRLLHDSEQRLLEMAAYQVAAQIHNARIHMLTEEALVQRLEQLSLIEDIAQQISQVLNVTVIIDSVLDAGLRATGADLCALALRDDRHSTFFKVIWKSLDGDMVRKNQIQMEMGEGVVGRVARTGETALIADNTMLERYVPPPEDSDYRSTLAVPLHIAGDVIGVLNLESRKPDFFTAEQAGFIRSLAGHAAISIDNASLLEERQQQIHTLTLLRDLALDTVRLMDDNQPVSGVIVKTALEILDGTDSALYAYQPDRQTLHLLTGITRSTGNRIQTTTETGFPLATIQQAADTRQLQTLSPAGAADHDALSNYASFVAIPILRHNRVYEVLCVTFDEPRHLDSHLLNQIDLLAVQAASHLENAALNEAIRTSNDRMRAILDSTRDGIILLNRDGYLQDANAAAAALLGLDIRAHIGEKFGSVVQRETTGTAIREIAASYARNPDDLNECEYQLFADNDETITYIKTLVSAVRDADSGELMGRLLVLRDITEEKSLAQFREKFQSMIIHDLRGPLGGVISAMHLAQSIVDTDFPDNRSSAMLHSTLDVSLESASNLLNLVDTLHDLPTIDRMSIEPEEIDLMDIVDQAYSSLSMNMREADIEVQYRIPDDIQPLLVDEDLIRRVFINLLQNAFKFTPEEGQIQIAADSNAAAGFMRVRISDTGPGIPDDMRSEIFKQGVQIKGRKPRTGGRGSGLGLNFCKLAVEAHGGYIRVEPDGPLSGACFAFTLPVADDSTDSNPRNGRSAAD
jgi:PAS domain S-box-containing protein